MNVNRWTNEYMIEEKGSIRCLPWTRVFLCVYIYIVMYMIVELLLLLVDTESCCVVCTFATKSQSMSRNSFSCTSSISGFERVFQDNTSFLVQKSFPKKFSPPRIILVEDRSRCFVLMLPGSPLTSHKSFWWLVKSCHRFSGLKRYPSLCHDYRRIQNRIPS